ncbi:DSD1 family PLP-dependent enzyme [Desulfovibrionales bacterium]
MNMDTSSDLPAMSSLTQLTTPCLVLDEGKMNANIARLQSRLAQAGVRFCPHLKTAKSMDIASRLVTTPQGPATVSTLREAEFFADCGIMDLTYAVGISPCKLPRVQALLERGVRLTILLDSVEQARAVAAFSRPEFPIPVLIELDCDGHRSGVDPKDADLLLAIAQTVEPAAQLRGVLTHAGESYTARTAQELVAAAEHERMSTTQAAEIVRAHGHACPVTSVGSTPTAHFAPSYAGISEVRAGVFVFFDLVQAGIGVCSVDDIALSVLATVIGHQREKGWVIIDAGWTALSADRGTASQKLDQGYGLVCDLKGQPLADLVVITTNQEHGIVAQRPGSVRPMPDLPIGTRVRILPNHACATAEQHEKYHVLGPHSTITQVWPRFRGW